MKLRGPRAFTLIELLVVISIIVILAGFMTVWIAKALQMADGVKCRNNLKQMGTEIMRLSIQLGAYPAGGSSPADWSSACATVRGNLKTTQITVCPSAKSATTNPTNWATCSYAYVGSLSPTYVCKCSTCGTDPGKRVWSLYWSGVDYLGGHEKGDFSTFKTLTLADNLVFTSSSADTQNSESTTQPTIPVHQDTEKFGTNDRPKYRTQRALRELPETPEDQKAALPLLFDVAVLKSGPSDTTIKNAHMTYVTESNKNTVLSTNHCPGSASSKADWGINVFYVSGAIEWKAWNKMRFQVMVKGVGADTNAKYYFFF